MLPLLTGKSKKHHETLFWCKEGEEWAVRHGDWKLRSVKVQTELFNLADDPSERTNLADRQPDVVKMLNDTFDVRIAQMADPLSGDRMPGQVEPAKAELTKRKKIRAERKEQRQAEKRVKYL